MKWKLLAIFLQIPLLSQGQVLSVFLTLLLGMNAFFLKYFFNKLVVMDEKIDKILIADAVTEEKAKAIDKRLEHIEKRIFKDS